jgi:hypothetical protein
VTVFLFSQPGETSREIAITLKDDCRKRAMPHLLRAGASDIQAKLEAGNRQSQSPSRRSLCNGRLFVSLSLKALKLDLTRQP